MLLETLISFLIQPTIWTYENPSKGLINVAYAEDYPPFVQEWNEETLELLIRYKAEEYGVDPEKALKVAMCESKLNHTIQSYHIRPDGTREDSWGLWQIHLPAHTTVTREMAVDPIESTEWAMEHLSKGRWWMWTCSRIVGVLPP